MENEDNKIKKVKINKMKFIRNIIISLIALGIVTFIFIVAPDYMREEEDSSVIHLIINNKNLTTSSRLTHEVLIENDIIYLSKEDVSRFFDTYLYYDANYNQYITTSKTKVATIEVGSNKMEVNGISVPILGTIMERNGIIYLPFSEMKDVYNVEIQNIEETRVVLIDSLNREQYEAQAVKNISVKYKTKFFSRTLDKVKKDNKVVVISEGDEGWTKVRTEKGIIGYVKTDSLKAKSLVRENIEDEKPINSRVSLVWDYYSESKIAPNRTGTTINGINVVSPSFFVLKKLGQGEIIDKVGNSGEKYIEWAKANNYKIWALFANDSMIETTSEILHDYKLRKKTIEKIVDLAVKYDLDGIDLDFENIYKEDKDLFTRFVVELYPRLKDVGLSLSVDVTAPDGGETWSLCYNRKAISENADYLIYMAYDQNNASSKKAGSVAGYNWVSTNVDKFLGQEGVSKDKIILAIPFYTRLWTENQSGEIVKTSTVNMKDVNNLLKGKGEPVWNELTRQNYIEYNQGNNICKMWIEDTASITEKLKLIKEKELAGAAFWRKDMEQEEVWDLVDEMILRNK